MEENSHGLSTLILGLQQLTNGVSHQSNLATELNVMSHQYPATPVGRV